MAEYRNIRTEAPEYEPMEYYSSEADVDLADELAGRLEASVGADVLAYPTGEAG